MFRARDFIETPEGLVFSVVLNQHPRQGIISHLRFRRAKEGLHKISSTEEAYRFLRGNAAKYLAFCPQMGRTTIMVPRDSVLRHYLPSEGLSRTLRAGDQPEITTIIDELLSRSGLGEEDLGLTGSFLVGAQGPESDIDLVVYGLENYSPLREALREAIGEGVFQPLTRKDWQSIYLKRGLGPRTDYAFSEFLWHELRKWNRAKHGNRRFDILSGRKPHEITGHFEDYSFKRIAQVRAECGVLNSDLGIDYPARYFVSNCDLLDRDVREIVSYTHTYVDQVREGETAICAGSLEEVRGKEHFFRIVVGTSREARGELLKVKGPDRKA